MKHAPRNLVIDWQETILKTDLPHQAKYLALYLRTYMNAKQDVAWPSLSRIVGETGLSKSTVARYLNVLEAEGWIQREKGNSKRSTRYHAVLPGSVTQTLRSVTQTLGVVSERHPNKQSNKQTNNRGSTRMRSLQDDLTDKSWADI